MDISTFELFKDAGRWSFVRDGFRFSVGTALSSVIDVVASPHMVSDLLMVCSTKPIIYAPFIGSSGKLFTFEGASPRLGAEGIAFYDKNLHLQIEIEEVLLSCMKLDAVPMSISIGIFDISFRPQVSYMSIPSEVHADDKQDISLS